jgi:hypothetical protein
MTTLALNFAEMLQLTTQLLKRRSRCYRLLVILVLLVILWACIQTVRVPTVKSLVPLIILAPLFALYIVADSVLVHQWHSKLVAAWLDGGVDVVAFKAGVRALPWLPDATIEQILTMLPDQMPITIDHDDAEKANRNTVDKLTKTIRLQILRSIGVAAALTTLTVAIFSSIR